MRGRFAQRPGAGRPQLLSRRLFTALRARGGLIHTTRVAHALAHVRSHGQMLALLTASTSQVELTTKNFDKHVFGSGKSAFVKFLAPW